eukprot:scaffold8360_cov54-Phaeocystis_antarctica.AAC.2
MSFICVAWVRSAGWGWGLQRPEQVGVAFVWRGGAPGGASAAHRHGLVQLGVLVVCLDLSGQLGARSTAQGSVRLGVSEGDGRDADHRWSAGRGRRLPESVRQPIKTTTIACSSCRLQG